MYCFQIYFVFVFTECICMFADMKGDKGKKENFQILIHHMDEKVYKAIKILAVNEKRSMGKQVEYILQHFIENTDLKPNNNA